MAACVCPSSVSGQPITTATHFQTPAAAIARLRVYAETRLQLAGDGLRLMLKELRRAYNVLDDAQQHAERVEQVAAQWDDAGELKA